MSLRLSILAAGLALGISGSAWAGAHQDFSLSNKTGYVLDKVFVSPTNEEDWGDDVLGRDTLDDGDTVDIHFDRDATPCKWDLKVSYMDYNESVYWRGIDLCSVSKITIYWDKNTDKTRAVTE
ncbi:MAG: argininosuccinate lyase [Magnetococcales bacterium]|nr:argininosuccinate lyase [Magnetococcales bacterium]